MQVGIKDAQGRTALDILRITLNLSDKTDSATMSEIYKKLEEKMKKEHEMDQENI